MERRHLAVCQVQEKDADHCQQNENSRKSGDAAQSAAFELCVQHKMQILIETPEQEDTVSEESESSLHESRELGVPLPHETQILRKVPEQEDPISEKSESSLQDFAEVDELEQKTDANKTEQQKNDGSIALEQDSSQTNTLETDAISRECDVCVDKLLKTDGNATMQQPTETAVNMLLVPDQKSIQGNDGAFQERDGSVDERLLPKSITALIEQLKKERSSSSFKDSTEMVANEPRQEIDEILENDRCFQENEYSSESEESLHMCLRTQGVSDSLPRTCHHRTCNPHHHIMLRSRLPPVQEDQEPPLERFEVEIALRRYRRLQYQLLPTGVRDYIRRVRDRHIPPERRALYEERQAKCMKLFFSILTGVTIALVLYLLIHFFQSPDKESNVASESNDYVYDYDYDYDSDLKTSSIPLVPEGSAADDFDFVNRFANLSTDNYISLAMALFVEFLETRYGRKTPVISGLDESDNLNFSVSTIKPEFSSTDLDANATFF